MNEVGKVKRLLHLDRAVCIGRRCEGSPCHEAREHPGRANSAQWAEEVQGLQEYDSPWEVLEEVWHLTRLLGSGTFKPTSLISTPGW